jgi:tetratricopeptide (TPR) repeat protein
MDKLIAEIERLNSELEKYPNDYETLLKIGNIYMMLEEYEKAENVFLQAAEAEPSYGPAYANLGELYGSFWEEKLKAVEYYKKAIELTPWRSQYYRSLADLYRSDFPEKEGEIEPLMLTGAEKYPQNMDFYTYLASYFRQKSDLSKAIYYLKAALKIEPDNETLKQELTELESF